MLLVVSREQSLANPSPDKQKTTGVRRNGVTPNERYLLDRVADLDTEPSVVLVRHVGADDTVHTPPIGVCPSNAAWANIRSELDETFASKPVEVKPQAILQTDSHSRSRHPISVPFVSENTCWNYFAAVGGVGAWGERCSSCRVKNWGKYAGRRRLLKLSDD